MATEAWTPNYDGNFLYRPAQMCAENFMIQNPNLVEDWIAADDTFGGNNTDDFVGTLANYSAPVPLVTMMDGGSGLRNLLNGTTVDGLAWPVGAAQTATFSPEFLFHIGDVGARDFKESGANTQLAPGLNLHRLPTCGRNWEYAGGEDAYLAVGQQQWVAGVQKNKVLATLKHYALNQQELNRRANIAQLDEATMMESYMPVFTPGIKAGVGAVMCAYNRVQLDETPDKIAWLCGDDHVLDTILRTKLGFGGVVMTDWTNNDEVWWANGTKYHNRLFDWEMEWGNPLNKKFETDLQRSRTIHHSLSGMFVSGMFEPEVTQNGVCENMVQDPQQHEPSIEHLPRDYQNIMKGRDDRGLAAITVAESLVLLKNEDDLLPLTDYTKCNPKKILLTGEYMLNGGGSGDSGAFSYHLPDRTVEGSVTGGHYGQKMMKEKMADVFGAEVTWDYELGATDDYSTYDVILAFGAQYRAEEFLLMDFTGKGDGFYNIDRCNSSVAKENVVMNFGNCDYPSFINQFQEARQNGTKVISVVTHGGVPIMHDFLDNVDAALITWYPGEQFYTGLADVLVGKNSPGGRLIMTIPNVDTKDGEDYVQSPIARFNSGLKLTGDKELYHNESQYQFIGLTVPAYEYNETTGEITDVIQYGNETSRYSEKNLIGYKYFEYYGMKPLFQFGYGMTYLDSSELNDVKVAQDKQQNFQVKVNVTMAKPSETMIASEVIQVYIGYKSNDAKLNVKRPIKELKGFKKVWDSGVYDIDIADSRFAWSVSDGAYVLPCEKDGVEGEFTVSVGFNTADILSETSFPCSL